MSSSLAYGGEYKTTNLLNSYVKFAFTGQSFSILYTMGPSYSTMAVYVDDLQVGSFDQQSSGLQYQKRWDYPSQLSSGSHTLKLVFTGPADTLGTLDAVIVH